MLVNLQVLVNLISFLPFIFNKHFDSEETQKESVYSQCFSTTNKYFMDSSNTQMAKESSVITIWDTSVTHSYRKKHFSFTAKQALCRYIQWTLTGKG